MKISYRTHPVLGLINGVNYTVGINRDEPNRVEIMKGLKYVFDTYKNELNKNIIVISQNFAEAAMACRSKMVDSELYKEIGDNLTGVLMFGKLSIIYKAERIQVNGVGAWALNIIEFFAGDALKTFSWEGIINYTDTTVLNETSDVATKSVWDFVQLILMFKKFAEVETKYLPSGQKIKDINCNYKNETKSNVLLLDSKWITTLVKSDAFCVRGHFRLQPKKKDGQWTKELIWINDFEKTGYTAPARKLSLI